MKAAAYTHETLNAFVDGELPGHEAAALLRDLAGNSALAGQVSELTRLKTAVQGACDDLPCAVPDLDAIFTRHERMRGSAGGQEDAAPAQAAGRAGPAGSAWNWLRHRIRLGLASGAMLAALALVAILVLRPAPSAPTDAFVARAVASHQRWLTQPAQPLPAKGLERLAAYQRYARNIYVPDLSASKLRIGRIAAFGLGGIHVGYVGTRDCHVSLFIRPVNQGARLALNESAIGKIRVFRWRTKRLDYALLAVGMDPIRLRLIAEDVFQATRLMQPFDQDTRMALVLNRQASQPCAA